MIPAAHQLFRLHTRQVITRSFNFDCKDKTCRPGYLSYRDCGFMYFPDKVFLPLLREIDDVAKLIVNFSGLKQEGDNLIKV